MVLFSYPGVYYTHHGPSHTPREVYPPYVPLREAYPPYVHPSGRHTHPLYLRLWENMEGYTPVIPPSLGEYGENIHLLYLRLWEN